MKWSELLRQGWVEADNGPGIYGYNLFPAANDEGDPDPHFILTCAANEPIFPDYPIDGKPALLGIYDSYGYADQVQVASLDGVESAKELLMARWNERARVAA